MIRYDWPRAPKNHDNPARRADHNRRLRPRADVASLGIVPEDVLAAPTPAHAQLAPTGDQNLWFPIGPSFITRGQAGGRPNVAGRIRDLQVEPMTGQRIYVASASGGVWFSADAGSTWTPLDDFQTTPDLAAVGLVANSLACGSLHVIWGGAANGSADELWVGTGELSGGAGGTPGGQVAGVGFLHRVGGVWSVVKGDAPASDADTMRGEAIARIAPDPGNLSQLVAATTKGIYVLPAGGSWTKASGWPKSGAIADHRPVEVLLTRTGANMRIWAAEFGHLWVAEVPAAAPIPAALAFTEIPLANSARRRIALAAGPDGNTVYVLGLRPKTPAEQAAAATNKKTPVAHLWTVNSGAGTIASLTASERPGLPLGLFMSASDQSSYDMCVVAHPTVAGRIYVGGAAAQTATGWNAALYRCDTTVAPVGTTLIGEGVHSDVHVLRIGPVAAANAPKRDMWVGCDGGLFHSAADGDPGTFAARNDGLAVLEAGYVASHPTNPGIVAAGFQDNGTGVRTGDVTWREAFPGDGGGLVWDPDLATPQPHRYLYQYTGATWGDSDNSIVAPVFRQTAAGTPANITKSQTDEDQVASFYSGADGISLGPADSHFAIGTNRVWYTRDFGHHWVTLPTATDPRAGNPADQQDVVTPQLTADGSTCSDDPPSLPHGIIAVKFASPKPDGSNARLRAISLYPGGLVWLTGTRPAASAGAFTWMRPSDGNPLPKQAFRAPKSGDETDLYNAGSNLKFLPAPGLVSDFAVHEPDIGPLGTCYVTTVGARDFGPGTPGARLDTLWFFDGINTWIPCGLRTDNPNGTWTGTRVTAPALGVVVDAVDGDRSTVYVATSVGVVKGRLTVINGPSYSWKWQLFTNGLPEAAVQDLSIRAYGDTRLLRAALQARGVWETDLASPTATPLTFLRAYPTDTRRLLPTPLHGQTTIGETPPPRWDRSPDVVLDATGTTPTDPSEALLQGLAPPGSAGAVAAVQLANRTPKLHVLVHHRWREAAPANSIRVALLRKALPGNGIVPLGGLWPVLVTAAATNTPPAGLPDGWTTATADFWRPLTVDVEARMPRAVTFDLNFVPATDPAGTTIVLLAVVFNNTNQITAADLKPHTTTDATTVDQLVRSSPHVGALTVELL